MTSRSVAVASTVGLHARPAALLATAVNDSGLEVGLSLGNGEPVDAGSILDLMALGVRQGDVVTLSAEGHGADALLDHLIGLLARDLDT